MIKADETFVRKIEDAKIKRIKNDIDKKLRSSREITNMITNCPSFPQLEKELTTLPRKKNRR